VTKYLLIVSLFLASCQIQAYGQSGQNSSIPQKATNKPKQTTKKPGADVVPLTAVLEAVEAIVDSYNSRPETMGANPKLPPLSTADFDFKTVADLKGGPSINLWIFKAGYTHDSQKTNEVDYQYKPQTVVGLDQQTLTDELSKAIEGAANQILGATDGDKSKMKLALKQFSITFAYSIGKEYTGGLNIPIHMVTLGGSLDKTDTSVQQVKLVFAYPDKKN